MHDPIHSASGQSNGQILVVDNDNRILELLSWFLTKRGFGVRTAQSFAEARERLREAVPDLMLSDIDLGGESALEELPRLSSAGQLPPTLVVSGYLDAEITKSLTALPSVLGTLSKPFNFTDLEERVVECMAARPRRVAGAAGAGSDDPGWVEITPKRPPAGPLAAPATRPAAHFDRGLLRPGS